MARSGLEDPAGVSGPRPDEARRRDELEVLYETIQDLTSTLAVHEVVERLLDRILRHLHAEIGSVLLLEPAGKLRITTSRGLPEEVVARTRIEPGEAISGYVLSTAEPLLVPDVEADKRFARRNHERYYTSSCISAPLVIDGTARGVINVNNKTSRQRFDSCDLRLLAAIAGQAAVALANAHRYEEMLQRAQRDTLTGLSNQGHFWSTLETELERGDRYERPLSLAMFDIDHFKFYNDRNGHLAGDRALAAVASIIAAGSRVHDIAARYGGEEFAVILPETGMGGANAFAEKIRAAIEYDELGGPGGSELTVSAGIATFPADGETPTQLLDSADRALYRAKEQGRNRVCGSESSESCHQRRER